MMKILKPVPFCFSFISFNLNLDFDGMNQLSLTKTLHSTNERQDNF